VIYGRAHNLVIQWMPKISLRFGVVISDAMFEMGLINYQRRYKWLFKIYRAFRPVAVE